jgi:peroxin-3
MSLTVFVVALCLPLTSSVRTLIPTLQDEIYARLDTERLKLSLKLTHGGAKLETWGELKIVCFTRLMVSIYSVSLLSVFLRLQINILGGYLFLQNSVL